MKERDLVRVDGVFKAASYWNVSDEPTTEWLRALLPNVSEFLETHRSHELRFVDEDDLGPSVEEPLAWADWLERGPNPYPTPRHFAEVLGCKNWEEVEIVIGHDELKPWWWTEQEGIINVARQAFERAVQSPDGAVGECS